MSFVDAAPELGVTAMALAARGLERLRGEPLLREGFPGAGLQVEPLIGSEWECEYYVDLGSRWARDERSGVEGFIIKAAVVERCDRGGRLVERVLHPVTGSRGGVMPLLPVVGDERAKQAASYLAELALALALARRGGPSGGDALVVRHGALLQQIGIYFNTRVYNVDCDELRAVLLYSLMDKGEASEIAALSAVASPSDPKRRCNAGIAAALLLERIKEEVGGGSSIVAVAEDLERTRYMTLHLAALAAEEYSRRDRLTAALLFSDVVEEARACMSWWGVDMADVRYGLPRVFEKVLARSLDPGASDPPEALREAAKSLGYGGLVGAFYRSQVLDRLGVSSDVEPLMMYRFLFGPRVDVATRPIDKGGLVEPPALESFRLNIGDSSVAGMDEERVGRAVRGFMMSYIFLDPTPTCEDLRALASRLGGPSSLQLVAEMVKVRHPVKLEYVEGQRSVEKIVSHIYTQAQATLYGAPAPLIVADQWSRVTGWDVSALRALLESLGRRVVPYSTFLRTFSLRRRLIS